MHPRPTTPLRRARKAVAASAFALLFAAAACDQRAEVYSDGQSEAGRARPDDKQCMLAFCPGPGSSAQVVPPGYCQCDCATGATLLFETPWPPSDAYEEGAARRWDALCPGASGQQAPGAG